jgi:hypothetical protein
MPETANKAMKDGPPLSSGLRDKLREQIVNARHNIAPSTYTLLDGVNFKVLPCPSVIVPLQGSTL